MALYLVDGPTTAAVSRDDVKKHLRVEHDDDNALIDAMIAAATAYVENIVMRALKPQTWELRLDYFPWDWCRNHWQYDDIELPLAPLIDVTSVKYRDANGDQQTVLAASYHVIGIGDRGRLSLISGQSWPSIHSHWPEGVIVRFVAGYDDTDSPPKAVPTPIVQAIKLVVSQFYDYREEFILGQTSMKLPATVEALLLPYRVFG